MKLRSRFKSTLRNLFRKSNVENQLDGDVHGCVDMQIYSPTTVFNLNAQLASSVITLHPGLPILAIAVTSESDLAIILFDCY